MNRLGYWNAHSDRDWYDATHGYDAPEPMTPEQEKLVAEEQEADMADLDREREQEARRRVLEEAARECDRLATRINEWKGERRRVWGDSPYWCGRAYEEAAKAIRALADKEPNQ